MNPYREPAERPEYLPSRRRLRVTIRVGVDHLLLAASVAVLTLTGYVAACTPPATAQQAAAEGAYGAALLRCVDEAETLEQSKACRARVDEQWGITQTATDGGAR